MISVVMPVFNAESTLHTTLASLATQTHRDWELIAVDDGSTDGSLALLKAFAADHPSRVRVMEQVHQGRSAARNAGLARVSGEFVALLDADDLWVTDKLEQQYNWLTNNPEFIGCSCRYAVVEIDGSVSGDIDFDWVTPSLLRWATLEGFGPGLCSTLLVRSEALRKSGYFEETLDLGEDVDLALRLTRVGPLHAIPASLMRYRRFSNAVPHDTAASVLSIEHLLRVEPFVDDVRLQRRLRGNHETFLAAQALRRGETMVAVRHLLSSMAIVPIGPARLLLARVRHASGSKSRGVGALRRAISRTD